MIQQEGFFWGGGAPLYVQAYAWYEQPRLEVPASASWTLIDNSTVSIYHVPGFMLRLLRWWLVYPSNSFERHVLPAEILQITTAPLQLDTGGQGRLQNMNKDTANKCRARGKAQAPQTGF